MLHIRLDPEDFKTSAMVFALRVEVLVGLGQMDFISFNYCVELFCASSW